MCKIRRLTEETSLWLGCSYVNRITRDCKVVTAGSTRTVQVYTTKKKKENLDKVPFYCKIHGDLRNRSRKEPKASAKAKPKTKKKTQTKSKLAAIAAKKRMSNLQTSHDREIYI